MIHAYSEIYLPDAQQTLASMMDYAVNDLSFEINCFFSLFIASGRADAFGSGDYRFIAGMSGFELARDVLEAVGLGDIIKERQIRFGRTPEFWTGWVIAYYQWWSALSFEEIAWKAHPDAIHSLYHPYHEMDITKICERLDTECRKETRLKNRRMHIGFSQSQLARASGVPVRTIQQYEQRERNINKAQADTVAALASTLCTESRYLLENV